MAKNEPRNEIPIPAWLLYRLADDSPLKGLWNMKSVPEKLEDLFGPGELVFSDMPEFDKPYIPGLVTEENDGEA